MNKNEYLQAILDEQTFGDSAPELKELRRHRKEIEQLLRTAFAGSTISICWGGAMAKGTMIRASYDGDMTCYFENEDTAGGTTLADIYARVASVLEDNYYLDRKTSALRVKDKSALNRGPSQG